MKFNTGKYKKTLDQTLDIFDEFYKIWLHQKYLTRTIGLYIRYSINI